MDNVGSFVVVSKSVLKKMINHYLERSKNKYEKQMAERRAYLKRELLKPRFFGWRKPRYTESDITEELLVEFDKGLSQSDWGMEDFGYIKYCKESREENMLAFIQACELPGKDDIYLSLADIERYGLVLLKAEN